MRSISLLCFLLRKAVTRSDAAKNILSCCVIAGIFVHVGKNFAVCAIRIALVSGR